MANLIKESKLKKNKLNRDKKQMNEMTIVQAFEKVDRRSSCRHCRHFDRWEVNQKTINK